TGGTLKAGKLAGATEAARKPDPKQRYPSSNGWRRGAAPEQRRKPGSAPAPATPRQRGRQGEAGKRRNLQGRRRPPSRRRRGDPCFRGNGRPDQPPPPLLECGNGTGGTRQLSRPGRR